ncbi:MAG: VTT domain-containing protein [Gordonia sp. (in: high G+C Gram-positive bacteria)]
MPDPLNSELVVPHSGPQTTPMELSQERTDRRRAMRNVFLGFAAVCALLMTSYLVPMPTVAGVRLWGEGFGAGFVWVFFLVYTLITVFPFPRTVFTVMSGVLFGPVIGLVGALGATMAAALIAFALARRIGRARAAPYLQQPVMMAVDSRLRARGWLAIGSLRLIPICPFWLVNWCAGMSSVRLLPYTLATALGVAPGTVAVVLLGDALTGQRNPLLLALSASFFAIGVLGLFVDLRMPFTHKVFSSETQHRDGPNQG